MVVVVKGRRVWLMRLDDSNCPLVSAQYWWMVCGWGNTCRFQGRGCCGEILSQKSQKSPNFVKRFFNFSLFFSFS